MKPVAVLIDFTDTCKVSVEFAARIAQVAAAPVVMVHVASKKQEDEEVEERMEVYAEQLRELGVSYDKRVGHGRFLEVIPALIDGLDPQLVVVGTHGIKGLAQNLFGAHILKLVRKLDVPSLVVQDQSKYHEAGFKEILFPIAPHDDFEIKIRDAVALAKQYSSKITLYCIERGQGFSDEIQRNIDLTKGIFEEEGIDYECHIEDATLYSVGYAKQTLIYAAEHQSDVISIMARPSDENRHFASMDKETMLLNEAGTPVLCSNKRS